MSEAVSVMAGAKFSGAVKVVDAGLIGMITLRGDLDNGQLAAAVKSAVGLGVPEKRQIHEGAAGAVAWMSPDELLLFTDYQRADTVVAALDTALEGQHVLALNVSDARAIFTLKGAGIREVVAKGAPADLSPEGLPIGEIRRTRLGQVPAAFWLSDEQTLTLVCFRSVGAFVYEWLCNAAASNTLPGVFQAPVLPR